MNRKYFNFYPSRNFTFSLTHRIGRKLTVQNRKCHHMRIRGSTVPTVRTRISPTLHLPIPTIALFLLHEHFDIYFFTSAFSSLVRRLFLLYSTLVPKGIIFQLPRPFQWLQVHSICDLSFSCYASGPVCNCGRNFDTQRRRLNWSRISRMVTTGSGHSL